MPDNSHNGPRNQLRAAVWKSENFRGREEFERVSKAVRHLAPKLVKFGGDDIFPRNLNEWRSFNRNRIADRLADQEHSKKVLVARIRAMPFIPPQGRTVKSMFGPGGTAMKSPRSPVLSQPTIWSDNPAAGRQSVWPNIAELLMYGDNRALFGMTSRSLPPPRARNGQNEPGQGSFNELPLIDAWPLDEVEPEFTGGPAWAEYVERNNEDDNDAAFQAKLENCLDGALREAISGSDVAQMAQLRRLMQAEEREQEEERKKWMGQQQHWQQQPWYQQQSFPQQQRRRPRRRQRQQNQHQHQYQYQYPQQQQQQGMPNHQWMGGWYSLPPTPLPTPFSTAAAPVPFGALGPVAPFMPPTAAPTEPSAVRHDSHWQQQQQQQQ